MSDSKFIHVAQEPKTPDYLVWNVQDKRILKSQG